MSEKQGWGISYFDQHGERHGCGVSVSEPPAFMQATEWKSQKAVRYYADKERTELEQRFEQLEQVAKDMCNYLYLLPVSLPGCPEYDHVRGFKDRLRELGVSLDD